MRRYICSVMFTVSMLHCQETSSKFSDGFNSLCNHCEHEVKLGTMISELHLNNTDLVCNC